MELEQNLLYTLQTGLPLTEKPFSIIADQLKTSEQQVLGLISSLSDKGLIRRIGGVFESRLLGYSSLLCAADVAENDLEKMADAVSNRKTVTHNYERKGSPNLWFTITVREDLLEQEKDWLRKNLAPYKLLNLPAIRRFKIQVILDGREKSPASSSSAAVKNSTNTDPLVFNTQERQLIRMMQEHLKPTSDIYERLAEKTGYTCEELLSLLNLWKEKGALKRLGAVLFHRKAGFSINSMCVWSVPEEHIAEKGRLLAENKEVTHCYERPSLDEFPYNLYAMIHAKSTEEFKAAFDRIEKNIGLDSGQILPSVREFKKTSPLFFAEKDD
ncbi:MAG: siroheme decarboxylase subunit beta [Planctomycetota bacterium]|jgi:DNA-binding Lrp family transcriptional regulator